jgi:uncharacterized alkaline shock family protein YloU
MPKKYIIFSRKRKKRSVGTLLYKFESENGQIIIEKAVIKRIVAESIVPFDGRVYFSNYKGQAGGIVSKIGGIDENNYISITKTSAGLEIKMTIVISFGTSINSVTEKMINFIKENVRNIAGIEVSSVTIIIAGMKAKQLVRRHIEVKG